MTDRELLQQALDVLEDVFEVNDWTTYNKTIEAIRTRLAQTEPEPVAKNESGRITWLVDSWPKDCLLYTTPPVSKSGDKKWIDEPQKVGAQPEPALQDIEQYRLQMGAISTAAIGYWKEGDGIHTDYDTPALRDVAKLYEKYDALYTAPPKKEWVGLTDEEHMQLATEWGCMSADWVLYAAAVERKIKEKNT